MQLFHMPQAYDEQGAGNAPSIPVQVPVAVIQTKSPHSGTFCLVGEEGLEPSRANAHKILSLACIPISPLALEIILTNYISKANCTIIV